MAATAAATAAAATATNASTPHSVSISRMRVHRARLTVNQSSLSFRPRSVLFLPRSSTLLCLAKPKPQSIIQRHRLRYATLAKQLSSGLHALQIKAKTPTEIEREALCFSRNFAVLRAHSRQCFPADLPTNAPFFLCWSLSCPRETRAVLAETLEVG